MVVMNMVALGKLSIQPVGGPSLQVCGEPTPSHLPCLMYNHHTCPKSNVSKSCVKCINSYFSIDFKIMNRVRPK